MHIYHSFRIKLFRYMIQRRTCPLRWSKEAFKGLVMECTSRDILWTATVRKLSRRARAYICAYYSLYESKKNSNHDDSTSTTLTLPLIERIVKAFKTHRAALDFDAGFLNGFLHSLEKYVFWMNTRSALREEWEYGFDRIDVRSRSILGFN